MQTWKYIILCHQRFGIQLKRTNKFHVLLNNLSSPKPGHTPGGSVLGGARRDGGAGRGREAQDADGTARPGENSPSYPSDDGRMTSWFLSLEARTKETLFKPTEDQKPQLTTGLPAVYPQDVKRSSFLDAGECASAYLSL